MILGKKKNYTIYIKIVIKKLSVKPIKHKQEVNKIVYPSRFKTEFILK